MFQGQFHINIKQMNTNIKKHLKSKVKTFVTFSKYYLINYKRKGQSFNHLIINQHMKQL